MATTSSIADTCIGFEDQFEIESFHLPFESIHLSEKSMSIREHIRIEMIELHFQVRSDKNISHHLISTMHHIHFESRIEMRKLLF